MLFAPRSIVIGAAALLSVPTLAGPPGGFNNWAVNNGTVAAGCAAGFDCSVLTTGAGFVQQQMKDPVSNLTYIKTIVTGPQSTGAPLPTGLPFAAETYVRTGAFDPTQGSQTAPTSQVGGAQLADNGISSQQIMRAESTSATKTGVFDSVVKINTGWAAEAGAANVDIRQTVSETGTDGTAFVNKAIILGNNDGTGLQTGTSITLETSLSQPKGTNSDGTSSGGSGWGSRGSSTTGGSSSAKDVQVFHLRRVGGNMLTTSGRATLGSRSVSWAPGDVVQTVWLGQGFDFGSFAGSGVMGFQSYDNLSDAVAQITTSSTSSTGPFSWVDPPFGTRPVMPANGGSSGSSSGGGGGGWR